MSVAYVTSIDINFSFEHPRDYGFEFTVSQGFGAYFQLAASYAVGEETLLIASAL